MTGEEEGREDEGSLGLRDYLALFVAILQTLALPFVILIIILLVIVAALSVTR